MEIIGVKEWSNRDHHYSQMNNPEEEILRKAGVKDWLETCGPTSSVSCMAAMGHDVKCLTPGSFLPQPESVLTGWFNDPRNYKTMEEIRKGTPPMEWMGNRIPQFYPPAVKSVFGVRAEFKYLDMDGIIIHLSKGHAVQACLVTPGHYIAILAYDKRTKDIIFNDSHITRTGLKNRGFNERIRAKDLDIHPWTVVYYES